MLNSLTLEVILHLEQPWGSFRDSSSAENCRSPRLRKKTARGDGKPFFHVGTLDPKRIRICATFRTVDVLLYQSATLVEVQAVCPPLLRTMLTNSHGHGDHGEHGDHGDHGNLISLWSQTSILTVSQAPKIEHQQTIFQ